MPVKNFAVIIISVFLLIMAGCGKKQKQEEMAPPATAQTPAVDTSMNKMATTPEMEKFNNPSMAKRGYTIQIYSFKDYDKAKSAATKFTNRGYKAYIEDVEVVGEGVYHRVRVGSYASIGQAKQAGRELKAKYGVNYWVDHD